MELKKVLLVKGVNLARLELLKTIEGLSPSEIKEMDRYARYLKWRNSGQGL